MFTSNLHEIVDTFVFMFCIVTLIVVLLRMTDDSGTMNQLYLKIDSDESEGVIKEKIKQSVTSVDDLYLSIRESDLDVVNDEIMILYQQQKIKRHHIEFLENLKADLNDIPKYESLRLVSGYSVKINESKDVVKLFSMLHILKHLQTVKLTLNFHTTENIDSFYESLHEFPSNTVEQLSIDRFLPYGIMFHVIRGFLQQSPNLKRIILYSALTTNALEHFQNQYVKEIETLTQKPLTIYIRTRDGSVVEKKFGSVFLKSLKDVEERQFGREYPFFVKQKL